MTDIVPTEADREAYLAFNMLPEFDAADVRAGRWDNTTGMQIIARHAASARKEALEEAAKIAETVEGHSPYCECALCLTTLSQAILQSIERGEG